MTYSEKVRQKAADRLTATDNAGWTADDMTDRSFALALCQCIEELDAAEAEIAELVAFIRDERETARLSGLAGEVRRFDTFLAKYPEPKPDPLVEVLNLMLNRRQISPHPDVMADEVSFVRAELEKRGGKIVWEKQS